MFDIKKAIQDNAKTFNPKEEMAQKVGKHPMGYLVYSVLADDAVAHKLGADKYGERNWRTTPIKASVYEGAILRHFLAWSQGEDLDPETGLSHLTAIRANCAVVLDSIKHNTFVDDRGRSNVLSGPEE